MIERNQYTKTKKKENSIKSKIGFLFLIGLLSCQNPSQEKKKEIDYCGKHFYLRIDENGIPNSENEVLLHTDETDSTFVCKSTSFSELGIP